MIRSANGGIFDDTKEFVRILVGLYGEV